MDNIQNENKYYGYIISVDEGNFFTNEKPFEYVSKIGSSPIEDSFNWYDLPDPYDQYGNKREKRGFYSYKINKRFSILMYSNTGENLDVTNDTATRFVRTYMDELKQSGPHTVANTEVHANIIIVRPDLDILTSEDVDTINKMMGYVYSH